MYSISGTKRTSLIWVFFISLLIASSGNSKVKGVENQAICVKVQEKTFVKLIRGMALDSAVKDGKVEAYPKVIVSEDEIESLDQNGTIISRISLLVDSPAEKGKYTGKDAILSSRGNFVAVHEYTGKFSDDIDYIVDEKYIVYDDRGNEIYRFKGPPEGAGEEDKLFISDKDGTAIRVKIQYGAIDFYLPDREVREIPILGQVGWVNRGANIAFSGDGEYLTVLMADRGKPSPEVSSYKADVWVLLFDKNSNELWRRKVNENQIGGIGISQKGEYVIFKSYTFAGDMLPRKVKHLDVASTTLTLLDKEGNGFNLKDTSLFSFGSFCFSPQADYLAMGGGNQIRLIKTKDGSSMYGKKLPENVTVRQLLFSDNGEHLIVWTRVPIGTEKITERATTPERQYRTVYTDRVFLYNMNGDEVWSNDFFGLRGIFPEDRYIAFFSSSPNRYEIYRINSGL